MGTLLLNFLLKLLTSEATKTLIGIGVNKLLEHKTDGITSDVAQVMIDGIAKSKANPTTNDVFNDALLLIK
ncbi:MAG: hypothetical protein WBP57_00790 [Ignavibacteria bacterium]